MADSPPFFIYSKFATKWNIITTFDWIPCKFQTFIDCPQLGEAKQFQMTTCFLVEFEDHDCFSTQTIPVAGQMTCLCRFTVCSFKRTCQIWVLVAYIISILNLIICFFKIFFYISGTQPLRYAVVHTT